ncbi:flagellar basal body rod protein FlgB [Duganella callida]|uniref:Flagellar basal body rod protein FlgB n=1 Tax=Duganella callida TaxID=2561932 RepID=A0A4Y9SNR1_9BURK|nr:flagellar basal body rod protein FlgB [Duganella callida]TFW25041.1 flagellar basal body rod protein FlgB [Duganella callida]
MVGRLDDYMRFNETVLSLRDKRQTVLASNIANADTPNYKARDIDFSSALQSALDKADPNAQRTLTTTAAKHYPNPQQDAGTLADGTPLLYRGVIQGAVDGNTVDMDVEQNQFADNAIRYEAGITAINGQIKAMLAAIQPGS